MIYAFYVSNSPGPGRQTIKLPGGRTAWLRVQALPAAKSDVVAGLDMARLRKGEQFMNTHDLGCPQCGRDALPGGITCGRGDCQVKEYFPRRKR